MYGCAFHVDSYANSTTIMMRASRLDSLARQAPNELVLRYGCELQKMIFPKKFNHQANRDNARLFVSGIGYSSLI